MYPKIDYRRRLRKPSIRPSNLLNNRIFLSVVITFLLISIVIFTHPKHFSAPRFTPFRSPNKLAFTTVDLNETKPLREPRIAKASMLYGSPNSIYEKALQSHVQHNRLHGYEMHVARTAIEKGFWNKMLWLQHLILMELQKPEADRIDWLIYMDASIVLLNPQVPLHVFLPPANDTFDSLAVIATKPGNTTLSTSSFFIRVSPTSINLLTLAMAAPECLPRQDWGDDIPASTLQYVLEQEEHRDTALYQPAHWYNSAVTKDSAVPKDSFLARFSHELQAERLKNMSDLLDFLTRDPKYFSKPAEDTFYATEPAEFWSRMVEAKKVLEASKERSDEGQVDYQIHRLEDVVRSKAWDTVALDEALDGLKESLDMGETPDEEIERLMSNADI